MKKKMIIGAIVLLVISICIYPIFTKKSGGSLTSSGSLKVYLLEDDSIQRSLVDEYKINYPQVKVEEVVFKDYEDYYTKLSSDLLSGNGPDVVFGYKGVTERLNKIIESGIFKDLRPLIEKEEEFSVDDYNDVIMNSGVYNDKQLFLPYDYSISMYITTKELLSDNKIELDGTESYKELIEALSTYFESGNIKDKLLFSAFPEISEFINMNELTCIDYKNKTVDFNQEEFKKSVETYKKIYESSLNYDLMEKYQYDQVTMMNDGKIVIENCGAFPNLLYIICRDSIKNGKNPIFLGSLKTHTAMLGSFMAINDNSKNQKEAFDFIKLGLSEEFQSKDSITYNGNLPINNKARDINIENSKKHFNFNDQKLLEIDKKYTEEINNIQKCIVTDQTVENLMGEELLLYFNDEKSLDNCVKDMEDKVKLYLNE